MCCSKHPELITESGVALVKQEGTGISMVLSKWIITPT